MCGVVGDAFASGFSCLCYGYGYYVVMDTKKVAERVEGYDWVGRYCVWMLSHLHSSGCLLSLHQVPFRLPVFRGFRAFFWVSDMIVWRCNVSFHLCTASLYLGSFVKGLLHLFPFFFSSLSSPSVPSLSLGLSD